MKHFFMEHMPIGFIVKAMIIGLLVYMLVPKYQYMTVFKDDSVVSFIRHNTVTNAQNICFYVFNNLDEVGCTPLKEMSLEDKKFLSHIKVEDSEQAAPPAELE